MNVRHATARVTRRADPLGRALGWLWALGMAAGFSCLGFLISDSLDAQDTAGAALSAPDSPPG